MGGLSFAGALGLSYVLLLLWLLLLLLRVGKFRDIGELPPTLKNWFLVDVFYVDSLLELFVQVCSGDPLVTSTWLVVLDQDRWPVVFSALEEHVQLLKVLWESLCAHLFCKRKLSKDAVATLFVVSQRLMSGNTSALRVQNTMAQAQSDDAAIPILDTPELKRKFLDSVPSNVSTRYFFRVQYVRPKRTVCKK